MIGPASFRLAGFPHVHISFSRRFTFRGLIYNVYERKCPLNIQIVDPVRHFELQRDQRKELLRKWAHGDKRLQLTVFIAAIGVMHRRSNVLEKSHVRNVELRATEPNAIMQLGIAKYEWMKGEYLFGR